MRRLERHRLTGVQVALIRDGLTLLIEQRLTQPTGLTISDDYGVSAEEAEELAENAIEVLNTLIHGTKQEVTVEYDVTEERHLGWKSEQ